MDTVIIRIENKMKENIEFAKEINSEYYKLYDKIMGQFAALEKQELEKNKLLCEINKCLI